MKKILFIIALLFTSAVTLIACKKDSKMATVIKNCTGYYLRVDGKDYRVCNYLKINSYSHGVSLDVKFKQIKKCDSNQIVCQMAYAYESDVKIISIH